MVILACLGDWLQDSGLAVALFNFGVTTSGNESLLSGYDVAATKYASRENMGILIHRHTPLWHPPLCNIRGACLGKY